MAQKRGRVAEPGLCKPSRSFCEQDHPCARLISGLCNSADPAIPAIAPVINKYPALDLALVIGPHIHGTMPHWRGRRFAIGGSGRLIASEPEA